MRIRNFYTCFKNSGISDVLGVDGAWVDKELLYKYLDHEEFFECDLEKEINLKKSYDLVVSLEVAEHIPKESADIFVKSLINAGNLILFSAAIPNQGGQNHINEQWLTYWEEKFTHHNYVIHDVIRPIFWDNSEVFWWYKQNMVLVTPKDYELKLSKESVPMRNIVHHELFQQTSKNLEKSIKSREKINKGKEKPIFYIKLLLYSIFGYDFFKKISVFSKKYINFSAIFRNLNVAKHSLSYRKTLSFQKNLWLGIVKHLGLTF